MKLSIRNIPGKPLDVALISHIERHAELALACVQPYVRQIRIGLLASRQPDGTTGTRCRVQLIFADEAPVNVTGIHADDTAAVNRALAIAGRLAARRVGQRSRQSLLRSAAVYGGSTFK